MTPSPLAYASRLRRDVRSLRAFVDGYGYGKQIAPPKSTGARFNCAEEPNPLERYFDAHSEGPGIWKWQHYFDVYHRHLERFRERAVHIVEVGIYSGGSLPMWRDYFGFSCHVYGVDIESACRAYQSDRIQIFIGDQGDPEFWRRFRAEVPTIDVVIDDGGHEPHQQITTLRALLPNMQPGGVYICEDIHGAFQPFHSFVDGLSRPLHRADGPPNALQQHVASVHRYPLITVLEKPAAPVPDFTAPRHGTQWQPFLK